MANSNPQAVRAANELFRRLADKFVQSYHFARIVQSQIQAEGIDALFEGNSKDVLIDGSSEDGRSVLTNEDLKQMIAGINDVIAFFDGNPSLRDLLMRIAVNPSQF